MFVPDFQGLTATDVVSAVPSKAAPRRFPFDVPHLTFYRARNAIYHLFRALKGDGRPLTVLVPDYNSGNEVLALRAAGAHVRYYSVGRDGQADPAEVEHLCGRHRADVLYVIHYLGWPQPIVQLADVARRRGIWLVEDCALALLSDEGQQPLGTFGHWSIFCLYKTLPLPNGACLVENHDHLAGLDSIALRQAGLPSVAGRTAELVVRSIRSRSDSLGAAVASIKRAAGRAVGAIDVSRAKVGDIGFDIGDVDLAMSDISRRIVARLDFEQIRQRRIANYTRLATQLEGHVTPLHREMPDGVCPLLFPIVVDDKRHAAESLRAGGVDVLEFWNHGAPSEDDACESANAAFLRAHVLGLPIHQDLTARHIDYSAAQLSRMNLRMS